MAEVVGVTTAAEVAVTVAGVTTAAEVAVTVTEEVEATAATVGRMAARVVEATVEPEAAAAPPPPAIAGHVGRAVAMAVGAANAGAAAANEIVSTTSSRSELPDRLLSWMPLWKRSGRAGAGPTCTTSGKNLRYQVIYLKVELCT